MNDEVSQVDADSRAASERLTSDESHDSGAGRAGTVRARAARLLPRVWWQQLLVLAIACVLVTIGLRAFVVEAYYVPSTSMEPTLRVHDRIAVSKLGGEPRRGDVVVFQDPGGWLGAETDADQEPGGLKGLLSHVGLYPRGGHLVKRVIGVPGDVVTCCDRQGRISVNGHPLDEDYLGATPPGQPKECNGPGIPTCRWSAGPVPAGSLFVLGDNRYFSDDSTAHLCTEGEIDCTRDPYVDEDLVVGRVWAVVWPLGRFQRLHRPATFAAVPAPTASGDTDARRDRR